MTRIEMDERRTHARTRRRFEASGSTDRGGVAARLVTSDLSLGGLYCTSDADFPEMTCLAVRLLLPDPAHGRESVESLDLSAVVVRRRKLTDHAGTRFELALLFTSLSEEQRESLARVVHHS